MWDEVLLFLVPFRSQIFDAFFYVFLDLVILPYFHAISINFYAVKCSTFILCNVHVCKWKNAYIKDLNALRILIKFLCIYLGEERGVH